MWEKHGMYGKPTKHPQVIFQVILGVCLLWNIPLLQKKRQYLHDFPTISWIWFNPAWYIGRPVKIPLDHDPRMRSPRANSPWSWLVTRLKNKTCHEASIGGSESHPWCFRYGVVFLLLLGWCASFRWRCVVHSGEFAQITNSIYTNVQLVRRMMLWW